MVPKSRRHRTGSQSSADPAHVEELTFPDLQPPLQPGISGEELLFLRWWGWDATDTIHYKVLASLCLFRQAEVLQKAYGFLPIFTVAASNKSHLPLLGNAAWKDRFSPDIITWHTPLPPPKSLQTEGKHRVHLNKLQAASQHNDLVKTKLLLLQSLHGDSKSETGNNLGSGLRGDLKIIWRGIMTCFRSYSK